MNFMTPGIETWLLRLWLTRGWASHLLLPLSWVYGALVRGRRLFYQFGWFSSEKVNATVIVVGNIVAGGAGKTPLTMAIVEQLKQSGHRVGIISRGYGREPSDVREVHQDSPAHEVGDEPLLMKRRCQVPVYVAPRRADAARALLSAYPDTEVLVCDDGLQHYALARDIEICALDARGLGNGRMLPAGPLREPWPRAVDLLIHTGQHTLDTGFSASRRLAPEAVNAAGQTLSLASLQGQTVHAVAAIAQPHAFFEMLQAQGLQLGHQVALADHASFDQWRPPSADAPWLCTEKDAVKLWTRFPNAWAVPLLFTPEPAFTEALQARLLSLHTRSAAR